MNIQEKIELLDRLGVQIGAPIGGIAEFFDGGLMQQCENGAIYQRPGEEPFEVHGSIYERYVIMGEVVSQLEYPISDVEDDPNVSEGRRSLFQNGAIFRSAQGEMSQTFNDVESIPQIMVKLFDGFPVHLSQGEGISLSSLGDLALFAGFPAGAAVVAEIENMLPGLVLRRVFDSLSPSEIRDLVGEAQARNPNYVPPNFENCLEIDCPNGFDLQPLVDMLKSWTAVVEYAYVARPPSEPGVIGFFNPLFSEQEYLLGGDKGIGAESAWAKGADGSGMSFIDIERGWLFSHHDLPQDIMLLDGSIRFDSMGHGAASLGEIVAIDDAKGVVGIAPAAKAMPCPSISRNNPATIGDRGIGLHLWS
jgi:hypothetical protein